MTVSGQIDRDVNLFQLPENLYFLTSLYKVVYVAPLGYSKVFGYDAFAGKRMWETTLPHTTYGIASDVSEFA